MKIDARILAVILGCIALIGIAHAGSTTLSLPSGTATARVGTDGSGNIFGNVGICDGAACANMAVVKGASTAAATTDPALVVAVSPNNILTAALNAAPSLTNGNGVVPTQGGAVLSASNPSFASIAQGGSTAAVKAANTVATTDVGLVVAVANALNPGAAAPGSSSPVVANSFTHASTTSLGTSLVAKSSAGNLAAYNCTGIAGASAGYCIVYNGTSVPATGALTGSLVLDYCYFDNTPKGCSLSRTPNSIAYSSGIVVLITSASSPYTYTTGTLTGAIEADVF